MEGIGQTDRASRLAPGSRAAAAVGLLIALVLPFIPLGRWIAPGEAIGALLAREAVWWVWLGIVLAWLLLVERQPVSSIGFRRPTWRTFVFAVLAAVIATAIMVFHYAVLGPALHVDTSVAEAVRARMMHTPYWCRVLMVLRAAVVEEILFRAYLMEKVRQLTGSWTLAMVVSVVAFTLAHLSGWGLAHLIPVCAAAIVFAVLYRWRRDTPSNIAAHFITDGLGFLTA